jgi:hypothetical protein
MKKYFLTVALVAAAASPAFAASHKRAVHSDEAFASQAYVPVDSQTVVASGQYLGRDPDPAVRLDLMREGDATQQNGN